jgi:hypothetical protein
MGRLAMGVVIAAALGCGGGDGGSDLPPCVLETGRGCYCGGLVDEPNIDTCQPDMLSGDVMCCASTDWPATASDCRCVPITCANKYDSIGTCSCGFGQSDGAAVQACSGTTCCLDEGFCMCFTASGVSCLSTQTLVTTCSITSMLVPGTCGSGYTQVAACE